ncbi:hypothetical protein ACFQNE_14100 [Gordonia phosphorivorans]|uniref:Uncharacterized protein n=1 Tax=Gordonia phosphorivorans TaxID=1056982 RepID=A0ABV6H8F2_9ACTN
MASLLISEVYILIAHHSTACAELAARFQHESPEFKDHMERIQELTDFIAGEIDYHHGKGDPDTVDDDNAGEEHDD